MTRAQQDKGFTLVESLLVAAMMALLVGIVWASLGPVRERGRQTVCISNLHQIGMAIQQYRADYGGRQARAGTRLTYPRLGLPPTAAALEGDYLSAGGNPGGVPQVFRCPSDERPPNVYSYDWLIIPEPWVVGGAVTRFRYSQLVALRGEQLPVMTDRNHMRPERYEGEPQPMLILRMGGRVEMKQVPRLAGPYEY